MPTPLAGQDQLAPFTEAIDQVGDAKVTAGRSGRGFDPAPGGLARFGELNPNQAIALFDDGDRPLGSVDLEAWPKGCLDAVGGIEEAKLGRAEIEQHERAVVDFDVDTLALERVDRVVADIAGSAGE